MTPGVPGREMKSSGAEWLGDVPSHWEIHRLKWSADLVKNGIWGEEADGGSDDIACVRVADFDRARQLTREDIPTVRKVTASERIGRVLRKGELLIEKSGGGELQPVGFVVLYDRDEKAVCSNFIARIKPSSTAHSGFFRYVHAAAYAARLNSRSIKQTTGIQNLDGGSYFDELAPFPPLTEQRAIASFLDRKTAQIDEVIARRQRQIGLLRSKCDALVSHAVTRGADVNSQRMPPDWETGRLKFRLTSISQGWSPQCESRRAEPGEWGVLKVGCVNSGTYDESENKALPPNLPAIPELEVQVGDILMSRSNTVEHGRTRRLRRDGPPDAGADHAL